ncbi:MAG: MBL fold metallo-hydrolase [Phycisphaerales bacterium]
MAQSSLRRYPAHIAQSMSRRARRVARSLLGMPRPIEALPADARLAAMWLGHASTLVRIGGARGVTILTDPVFSERIGMRVGRRVVGVQRLVPAPLLGDQPVDVVLISHAHFDHLDRPTLATLAGPGTVVITSRGTRGLIPQPLRSAASRGFARIIELDWHESVDVKGVTFTAYKPRHWGARTIIDQHRGYNAYVIETKRERVLFAGDTAFTHAFDGIAADLAIFGIGAYEPWEHAHATPEQVWAMFQAMRAKRLLPMHHSTFQLGDDKPGESMDRLLAAAGKEWEMVLHAPPGRAFVLRA